MDGLHVIQTTLPKGVPVVLVVGGFIEIVELNF